MFADGQRIGDLGDLQHYAGSAPRRRRPRILPEERDRPSGGPGQAEKQLHGGRLAGAVGAKNGGDAARLELDCQVVECDD